MAFSSISFLFYFLPLFFIIYYLIPARAKNVVLLVGRCGRRPAQGGGGGC